MGILPQSPLQNRHARALIAEAIGTFFLVFAITTSQVYPANHPFSAGFTLMTQVFTYGYISGGMFNPAVSTGVFLVKAKRGQLGTGAALWTWASYVGVQLVAGTVGALAAFALIAEYNQSAERTFFGPASVMGYVSSANIARAWWAEFLWTTLLVSSVLHTAVSKQYPKGNHFFGLTIGLSVFAGAMTVGPWSGGAFNPAVSFGTQLAQCISIQRCDGLKWFWIYFVANFPAGFLAALLFSLISCEDKDDEEHTLIQKRERLLSPP